MAFSDNFTGRYTCKDLVYIWNLGCKLLIKGCCICVWLKLFNGVFGVTSFITVVVVRLESKYKLEEQHIIVYIIHSSVQTQIISS